MAISYKLAGPNNNIIVVDRTRSADPINTTLVLSVQNQSPSTIYYKIAETSGSWSISSPTNGELGSVDSGSTKFKKIVLQRALPTSDTIETINFTLEAYSDSGYTNLIDSTSFSVTVIIADIHSWTSYTKYDFDDGTSQGWSLTNLSVSSDVSITAGGYSLEGPTIAGDWSGTLTKSETLPSNSRVVLMLYYTTTSSGSASRRIRSIKVKINGNTVCKIGGETGGYLVSGSSSTWDMVGVDLSDYAGQSVTVDIVVYASYYPVYIDDIIIAGTDAL